jgi:hypothetical protein
MDKPIGKMMWNLMEMVEYIKPTIVDDIVISIGKVVFYIPYVVDTSQMTHATVEFLKDRLNKAIQKKFSEEGIPVYTDSGSIKLIAAGSLIKLEMNSQSSIRMVQYTLYPVSDEIMENIDKWILNRGIKFAPRSTNKITTII